MLFCNFAFQNTSVGWVGRMLRGDRIAADKWHPSLPQLKPKPSKCRRTAHCTLPCALHHCSRTLWSPGKSLVCTLHTGSTELQNTSVEPLQIATSYSKNRLVCFLVCDKNSTSLVYESLVSYNALR